MVRDYVVNLKQRFNSAAHMAEFMGVSVHTVNSWAQGNRQPSGEAVRFLQVLGLLVLEAPHVFDALIGKQEPARCKPIVLLPPLQPLPVKQTAQPAPFGRAQLTPEQIAERDARNAAYWAAVDAGEQPVEQAPVVPFVPHVKTIAGRTLDQWQAEWDDPGSEAFDALSLDDNDRVLAWLGK